MKTFTKVILILAGVLSAAGVICMVIAFAMGFSKTHLWGMVEDGQFSFDSGDLQIPLDKDATSEMKISDSCDSMEIEFGAGYLEIYYDDVEEIQIKNTNIPNLKAEIEKNTLVIKEKSSKSNLGVTINSDNERKLEIILPKDKQFQKVEIEVGAGQAEVSGLMTKSLEVEVGAGQVNIDMIGEQTDYNYEIESGVGTVIVGEMSFGGLGAEQNVRNEGATKEIKVECGVGEVRINFVDFI